MLDLTKDGSTVSARDLAKVRMAFTKQKLEPSLADAVLTALGDADTAAKLAPAVAQIAQLGASVKLSAEETQTAILEALGDEKATTSSAFMEVARDRITMAWKAAGDEDIQMPGRPTYGVGGSYDSPEGFRAKMIAGLTARFEPKAATPMGRDNAKMSIGAVAMECARRQGLRPYDAFEAIKMVGVHTTSDFSVILDSTMSNIVARRYEQRKPDLLRVSREVSRADYRPGRAMSLNAAPMPSLVPEGGEIKYITIGEHGEVLPKLDDYAAIFAVSNQLLANDSTAGAHFDEVGNRMAEGAVERLRTILSAPLAANGGDGQTLLDGLPLFHADHGNVAASPSALSITSLSAARTTLRTRRGPGGELLAIKPSILLVPAALETTAQSLLADLAATKLADVNPFSNSLELIVDPTLDAISTTAWYLVGEPSTYDGLTHAFLDGRAAPTIESRDGWNTLHREWRLTWAMAAGFIDTAGWFRNAGA